MIDKNGSNLTKKEGGHETGKKKKKRAQLNKGVPGLGQKPSRIAGRGGGGIFRKRGRGGGTGIDKGGRRKIEILKKEKSTKRKLPREPRTGKQFMGEENSFNEASRSSDVEVLLIIGRFCSAGS